MAGIVFLRTTDRSKIVEFYTREIGMRIWLEQPEITILRHENLLVGFQQHLQADTDALLTFFYPGHREVDRMFNQLQSRACDEPRHNQRYRIYNFFAHDPEERRIEFQCFLHDVPEWR
ncbi:MAG: VOC family protein [Spirochaetaceae bacterium]|nr:MAG: VOC family protein [Spirochaetaceae bacterium]